MKVIGGTLDGQDFEPSGKNMIRPFSDREHVYAYRDWFNQYGFAYYYTRDLKDDEAREIFEQIPAPPGYPMEVYEVTPEAIEYSHIERHDGKNQLL